MPNPMEYPVDDYIVNPEGIDLAALDEANRHPIAIDQIDGYWGPVVVSDGVEYFGAAGIARYIQVKKAAA